MWAGTSSSNPASPTTAQIPSLSSPTYKMKHQGKRIAQIVKLKKEHVEEYKTCHAKVWPEVSKQIKESNIEDYSIFYDDGTGILFANFKYVGYNYAGDMEKMAANPKVQEWWRMTDGFQESFVSGAKSSQEGTPPWWKGVEEVFYMP